LMERENKDSWGWFLQLVWIHVVGLENRLEDNEMYSHRSPWVFSMSASYCSRRQMQWLLN